MQKVELVKPIQHTKWNKIDGMLHLKHLSESGKLPGLAIEKFNIVNILKIPDYVMAPERDSPLLVRTSFQAGIEASFADWETQPRARFKSRIRDKGIELQLQNFMCKVIDYSERIHLIDGLLALLPNQRYFATGTLLLPKIPMRDNGSYEITASIERARTEEEKHFRMNKVNYREVGNFENSTMAVKYDVDLDKQEKEIFHSAMEKIRKSAPAISNEMKNRLAEVSFVIYQGSNVPCVYDWLIME